MNPVSNLTPAEVFDKKARTYLSGPVKHFFEACSGSIDFSSMAPDHICYRCETPESYKELFDDLSAKGKLLDVSIFGEREIAIFESPYSFETPHGDIPLIELCAQKKDHSQKEGFEHIEFAAKDKKHFWIILGQFQKLYPKLVEKQTNDRGTFEIKIDDTFTFIVQVEPLMNTIERRKKNKSEKV